MLRSLGRLSPCQVSAVSSLKGPRQGGVISTLRFSRRGRDADNVRREGLICLSRDSDTLSWFLPQGANILHVGPGRVRRQNGPVRRLLPRQEGHDVAGQHLQRQGKPEREPPGHFDETLFVTGRSFSFPEAVRGSGRAWPSSSAPWEPKSPSRPGDSPPRSLFS
jgi:hypothetical protein